MLKGRLKKLSSKWDGLVNNLNKTEIPEYAINKSLPSDSYFTSDKTAKKCFSIFIDTLSKENIDIEDYIFIEPSAGGGVFYNLMPSNTLAWIALSAITKSSFDNRVLNTPILA